MILTLSIAFGLSGPACKKPTPVLVPLGESRTVGQIKDGAVTWAKGEDGKGLYIIVTKAFVWEANKSKEKVELLDLELKKCREKK